MRRVIITWLKYGLPILVLVVAAPMIFAGGDGSAFRLLGWHAFFLVTMGLACEYVDSTLGMGYGTALTPLLLFMGYAPLDVVPAVLLSELVTGAMAAVLHHKAGNVNFNRRGRDLKIGLALGACSILGTLVAVLVAINIPKIALKFYIGALVTAMGVIILVVRGREGQFSWKRVVGLGVLASFNKGMSGGGYGPVVTCGQILSGVKGKRAVGITSLAEGLTCLVGVLAFMFAGEWPNWGLAVPLVVGAVCSTPLSALSVKRMGTRNLVLAIGILTTMLGVVTLAKTLL